MAQPINYKYKYYKINITHSPSAGVKQLLKSVCRPLTACRIINMLCVAVHNDWKIHVFYILDE